MKKRIFRAELNIEYTFLEKLFYCVMCMITLPRIKRSKCNDLGSKRWWFLVKHILLEVEHPPSWLLTPYRTLLAVRVTTISVHPLLIWSCKRVNENVWYKNIWQGWKIKVYVDQNSQSRCRLRITGTKRHRILECLHISDNMILS